MRDAVTPNPVLKSHDASSQGTYLDDLLGRAMTL